MNQHFWAVLAIILSFWVCEVKADTKGKIDIGPAFVHLDILESGKTIERLDMWAIRGDGAYYIYQGLSIKPTFLYGNGGGNRGGIFTGALALNYTIPVHEQILIAPGIGMNYCHVWTKIDIPTFFLKDLREDFKSWAPFLSLDLYYNFAKSWRICLSVQYAWSKTRTTIHGLPGRLGKSKSKSKSEGFAYSGMIEHDLTDVWSFNLGAAYNVSLTKEKHGLRGTGLKLGLVRWF